MTTLLAGDIGGTKTLLSLHAADGLETLAQERYSSADWPDLAAMVNHFLGGLRPAGRAQPAVACLAVAGPVQGGRARLTNLPWSLEEQDLARACAIPCVELVNDFAVLIYGLPHLQAHQQATVRAGSTQPDAPLLIDAGMVVETVAPLCIVTGKFDRLAAVVLAGFCAVTAVGYHQFWTYDDLRAPGKSKGREEMWEFLKNFGLVGGLLMVVFPQGGRQ